MQDAKYTRIWSRDLKEGLESGVPLYPWLGRPRTWLSRGYNSNRIPYFERHVTTCYGFKLSTNSFVNLTVFTASDFSCKHHCCKSRCLSAWSVVLVSWKTISLWTVEADEAKKLLTSSLANERLANITSRTSDVSRLIVERYFFLSDKGMIAVATYEMTSSTSGTQRSLVTWLKYLGGVLYSLRPWRKYQQRFLFQF